MRVKKLGSRTEIRAHEIIRRVIADREWTLTTNASVQAVLEKEERLSAAEFDLYTRGAFDFVVYDPDYAAAFALEVDGFGHDDARQVRRDLIKNALCQRAGLPLMRIGANELQEREDISVLEWLVHACVAEAENTSDDDDDVPFFSDEASSDAIGNETEELTYGVPGLEMDTPFPDNGLVATRLWERHKVETGEIPVVLKSREGARYRLHVRWPGLQPPRLRTGTASEFVVSERDYVLIDLAAEAQPVHAGTGRAEFAWAHRLPAYEGRDRPLARIDLPWDGWGVARELAEFEALKQVEAWLIRHTANAV